MAEPLENKDEGEELVALVCGGGEAAGRCRVPARLLPLARCEGKEGAGVAGARLCVKYTPSCSCKVSS